MGVFGFILAITFWLGLSGAAEASRWATLCIAVPAALFFVKVKWSVVHIAGAFLLGYGVLSLAWTPVWYDGVAELVQLTVLAGAFLIGSSLNIDGLWKGFGLGLFVSSAVCILQAFGFNFVPDTGAASSGLFVNPNVLAEITAVVFIALAFEKRWWLMAGLAPALILTECRSALLAVFTVGTIAGWRRWGLKVLYGLPLLVGAALLTANKWAITISTNSRLDMWRDTMKGLTAWGHGVGSFYSTYPLYATHLSDLYQPSHAHNDLLELAFELGVIPAIFILFLVLALVWRASFKDQCLLLSLAIMSMVGFPLHTPATVFAFGVVAGCAARNWVDVRGVEFVRGHKLYEGGERPDYAGA